MVWICPSVLAVYPVKDSGVIFRFWLLQRETLDHRTQVYTWMEVFISLG